MITDILEEQIDAKPEPLYHSIVPWLDGRIQQLVQELRKLEGWQAITDPGADPHFVQRVMQEIYFEIIGYQPHVIEAAIAAIAQMPRTMDPKMVRAMLFHQADEFDHGEMALRDYVALGGAEQSARASRMSRASFAAAGVWWMIVHLRDPFAYLGALYLFEGLTPIVTGAIKTVLRQKELTDASMEYVNFHSTEDVKHANLVRHLISRTATRYPEAVESMKHGYECFEFVYPIPVWNEAYRRAKAGLGL